jgi:hypothetical protein
MNEEVIESLQSQGYEIPEKELNELSNNELVEGVSEQQIVDYLNLQKKVAAAEESPTPENVEAAKTAQEKDIKKDEATEKTLNSEETPKDSSSEIHKESDSETPKDSSSESPQDLPSESSETSNDVPVQEHPEDDHKEVV